FAGKMRQRGQSIEARNLALYVVGRHGHGRGISSLPCAETRFSVPLRIRAERHWRTKLLSRRSLETKWLYCQTTRVPCIVPAMRELDGPGISATASFRCWPYWEYSVCFALCTHLPSFSSSLVVPVWMPKHPRHRRRPGCPCRTGSN